jgi:GNAT superfamily N-acetyltransferase
MAQLLSPGYQLQRITKLNFLQIFQIFLLYIPDFIALIICYLAAWLAIIAILQVEIGILKSFIDILLYLFIMPLLITIIITIISCADIVKLCIKKGKNRLNGLFILKNKQVIAFVFFSDKNNYYFLNSLRVKKNYRKKGLGSYLVNQVIQEAIRPIYLIPTSESFKFYTTLGFAPVSEGELPEELKLGLGYLGLM